jgi:hypothetical protein
MTVGVENYGLIECCKSEMGEVILNFPALFPQLNRLVASAAGARICKQILNSISKSEKIGENQINMQSQDIEINSNVATRVYNFANDSLPKFEHSTDCTCCGFGHLRF